jgi:hypothetical protein
VHNTSKCVKQYWQSVSKGVARLPESCNSHESCRIWNHDWLCWPDPAAIYLIQPDNLVMGFSSELRAAFDKIRWTSLSEILTFATVYLRCPCLVLIPLSWHQNKVCMLFDERSEISHFCICMLTLHTCNRNFYVGWRTWGLFWHVTVSMHSHKSRWSI